jgi:cell division septal protein FtsQ
MWFKRKSGNRKLARENVLEVKLRTRESRRNRVRLMLTALALAAGTLLGLYLLWRAGDWTLRALVFENNAFALDQIEIRTDGQLPRELLLKWSGVKRGQNLLALDVQRVGRDLELVPLVRHVSVQREPPRGLRLEVSERVPLAEVKRPRLRPGEGTFDLVSYYFDETGYVIQLPEACAAVAEALSSAGLPQLAGIDGRELLPGRTLTSPAVQAALRLIAAFDDSPMGGLAEIDSVNVAEPSVLEVTTRQGNKVVFGLDRPEDQLRRWRLVYDFGQKQGKAIRLLDLSVTNNSPVLFLEASAAPDPAPKTAKPSRNRKRHV